MTVWFHMHDNDNKLHPNFRLRVRATGTMQTSKSHFEYVPLDITIAHSADSSTRTAIMYELKRWLSIVDCRPIGWTADAPSTHRTQLVYRACND
jgi:hypothetical protein